MRDQEVKPSDPPRTIEVDAVDETPCPSCGTPNPSGAHFCMNCGGPLEAVPDAKRRRAIRPILAGLLVFVTCLLIAASVAATWVHQTLFDTDRWVETTGPLVSDPEVVDALSRELSNQIVVSLDVQSRVEDVLPERAALLAAPLTSGLRDFLEGRINTALESETVQRIWVEADRFAHSQVVRLLREEDTETLQVSGGQVTLNLIPVVNEGLTLIEDQLSDLLGRTISLPDVSDVEVPEQALSAISDQLGVTLPSDFGQIVVFESDELGAAQDAVQTFDRGLVLLIILTVVLLGLTLLVSPRRRRTLVQLGVGTAAAIIVIRRITYRAEDDIVAIAKNPENRPAVRSIVSSVLGDFRSFTVPILVLAIVVAIVAFLAGKPQWIAATRRRLSDAASSFQPGGSSAAFATKYFEPLRIGGLIAAIIIFLLVDVTWWWLLAIVVLLGLFELGLYWAAGRWRPARA